MGVINKTTEEINNLLNKVENMPQEGVVGKTPVLETGTTTTLPAGSEATSEVKPNGTDSSGNPKYLINFGIPKGEPGSSGGGGVSDSIEWNNVINKPTWVNSTTKPTYTASEVGALPASTTIPSRTSQLTNDSNFVTSTGFKTINGESVVGSGNIEISGTGSGIADAPSDGKIYGRKNKAWVVITSTGGGSIDITALYNRIMEIAEVQGQVTESDYNELNEYIESGTSVFVTSENDIVLPVKIYKVMGILCIYAEYDMGTGSVISNTIFIQTNRTTTTSQEQCIYTSEYAGEGKLGQNYNKQGKYSAIQKTDSIAMAIGKLEAVIGGSGGANTCELPSAILSLTEDSTKDEIYAAFGGDDGIAAIKSAIDNKYMFYISEKGVYNRIINVDAIYTSVGVVIRYSYRSVEATSNVSDLLDITICASKLLPFVTIAPRYGYKFNKALRSINTSSSSSDIQSALGIEPAKLAKKLKSGSITSYFIDSGTGKIPISIEVEDSGDGNYMFAITASCYGVFGSTSNSTTLIIQYEQSNNTYTAMTVESAVKE